MHPDQTPTLQDLVYSSATQELLHEQHRRRVAEAQVQILQAEVDELRGQLSAAREQPDTGFDVPADGHDEDDELCGCGCDEDYAGAAEVEGGGADVDNP